MPSRLASAIATAVRDHQATFNDIRRRRSTLLELGAMMLAVQHYEKIGYAATPENLSAGRFKAKWWTQGDPRDSSWWRLQQDASVVEAHLNAPVWDGHGGKTATFVVDVGVVKEGAVVASDPDKPRFRGFQNRDLRTFIESKGLPIYPMLLAQFVGIAHEITPWAIAGRTPRGFLAAAHFDPTLVSLGFPRANTERLLAGMAKRGLRLRVIPAFENYIEQGRLQRTATPSILSRRKSSLWPAEQWAGWSPAD